MYHSKTYLAVPPGATLKELIDDRGMSQKELANRMGVSPKHVSELINGKVGLTEKTAIKLQSVLGISADVWMNLEHKYRMTLGLAEEENEMDQDIQMLSKFPFQQMVQLGWIREGTEKAEKVRSLREFLQVACLSFIDRDSVAPAVAYRKLMKTDRSDVAALCWLQKAKELAEDISVKDLDLAGLRSDLPAIREMSTEPLTEFRPALTDLLARRGIALVLLPSLQGSGIHGATFISGKKIVIAVSDRNKDSDRFWFSLLHEIGHILNGDILAATKGINSQAEMKADEFARNTLIEPENLKLWLSGFDGSDEQIKSFCRKNRIHPSILVGRLQNEGILKFNQKNYLKDQYSF